MKEVLLVDLSYLWPHPLIGNYTAKVILVADMIPNNAHTSMPIKMLDDYRSPTVNNCGYLQSRRFFEVKLHL